MKKIFQIVFFFSIIVIKQLFFSICFQEQLNKYFSNFFRRKCGLGFVFRPFKKKKQAFFSVFVFFKENTVGKHERKKIKGNKGKMYLVFAPW